ncbi:hypothetical protein [Mucilaginibacter celer]|uniref:HNH endonuclease n=1 Tax=Mucilaginibacter celer TaxID=2305508 RepID=A0A494VTI3_9SPHI|nr:hypothetical protein [Mucilaginibacter celer]AYL94252.1 hypothetical protein HYN43_002610 [Mucilaginibacter celer]
MTRAELKKIFDGKKEYLTKRGVLVKGFKLTTFTMFEDWFNLEIFEQGCHYCGLKNEECYRLFLLRPYATRNGKRGRRLELDRMSPLLEYDELHNIRWCCYWCNNAKSNFFSEAEFRPVAAEMGKALRKVLETEAAGQLGQLA